MQVTEISKPNFSFNKTTKTTAVLIVHQLHSLVMHPFKCTDCCEQHMAQNRLK